MTFELNGDLITEDVDGDLLICDSKRSLVHRLDGEAASLVRSMRTTSIGSLELSDHEALSRLIDLGIVIETKPSTNDGSLARRTMSRRKVMGMSAAAATAGIITLALPEAAAAVSVPGFGEIGVTPGLDVPDDFGSFEETEASILLTTSGRLRLAWAPYLGQLFTYGWKATIVSSPVGGPPLGLIGQGVLTSNESLTTVISGIPSDVVVSVSLASNTAPVRIFTRSVSY